ncbi:MAG: ATP-binding protein [Lachnospiraceae bacterium]|nr:ATP-binding protein [Lachnospiraceae bacterium]
MKEITVEAKRENLGEIFDFVVSALTESGCDKKLIRQCKLCVEEIFLNISSYAYHPETGPATVTVELANGDKPLRVKICFIDKGKPFDPLSENDPDIESELDERQIGGLGIFLVRTTMDDVFYEYTDGKNVLTMQKRFV